MAADDVDGLPEELLRYVARFDRREYWLAHEELEELWQVDRRDPFKGLIQIAAAFVHIERDNWRGARRLLRTALEYLDDAPDHFEGFDVVAVRARTAAALEAVARLAEGDASAFDESLRFVLAPLFDGEVAGLDLEEIELPYRVRRYERGYRAVARRAREGEQERSSADRGETPASWSESG